MDVQQDCPEPGCWWQKPDIARKVMAFLPTRDVLACDLVCKDWAALKVSQGLRAAVWQNALKLQPCKAALQCTLQRGTLQTVTGV